MSEEYLSHLQTSFKAAGVLVYGRPDGIVEEYAELVPDERRHVSDIVNNIPVGVRRVSLEFLGSTYSTALEETRIRIRRNPDLLLRVRGLQPNFPSDSSFDNDDDAVLISRQRLRRPLTLSMVKEGIENVERQTREKLTTASRTRIPIDDDKPPIAVMTLYQKLRTGIIIDDRPGMTENTYLPPMNFEDFRKLSGIDDSDTATLQKNVFSPGAIL